ncbi:MAG: hypothetical protein WBM32_19455 [Crocosphaera sp.]|jgi:hypothetical protein
MFVGTTEAANRLGISGARLRVLLQEGRAFSNCINPVQYYL